MRRAWQMSAGLLVAAVMAGFAQQSPNQRAAWNKPVEPFRIAGNIYYVGAAGVSAFLIRTADGSVLLDGGLPETASHIVASIARLGFDIRDVKVLLNSHAHYDHAGGLAELKRLSGATVVVSAADSSALKTGSADMPPIGVERILRDRDTVTVGGATLTAHVTPGHTKGCTTWTMSTSEAGRSYDVIFHCSTSVVDTLIGNKSYPNVVSDYQRTFERLASLNADIFLGAHPGFFNMEEKRRKVRTGGPNPFVDPSELHRFNEQSRRQFQEALDKERSALPVIDDPEADAVYAALVSNSWLVRSAKASRLVVQEETVMGLGSRCTPSGQPLETEWRDVFDAYKRANDRITRLRPGQPLHLPYVLVPGARITAYFAAPSGFETGWPKFRADFPDARGFVQLSAVGFNRSRTRAMVYFGHSCGSLCGQGMHYLLEKSNGAWREVRVPGVNQCMWVS